jgi:hypothetical protein
MPAPSLVPVGADEPLRLTLTALMAVHVHDHPGRAEVLAGSPQVSVGDAGDRVADQARERSLPQPATEVTVCMRDELLFSPGGPVAQVIPDSVTEISGI